MKITKTMFHGSNSFNGDEFNFNRPMWLISDSEQALQYGSNIFEVVVTLNNPYISSHQEKHSIGDAKIIAKAKHLGYDGIVMPPDNDMFELYIYYEAKFTVIIAFNKNQIKSIKPLEVMTESNNQFTTFLEALKPYDVKLITSIGDAYKICYRKTHKVYILMGSR